MFSFRILLILIPILVASFSKAERTDEFRNLCLDFSNEPETIEYAKINVTRSRRGDTRAPCCISLLGGTMVCSRYDLFVEYTGKMTSSEVTIDCQFIESVQYTISRKFKISTMVSIIVGISVVLLANGAFIYYILKKTRTVVTPATTIASNANA